MKPLLTCSRRPHPSLYQVVIATACEFNKHSDVLRTVPVTLAAQPTEFTERKRLSHGIDMQRWAGRRGLMSCHLSKRVCVTLSPSCGPHSHSFEVLLNVGGCQAQLIAFENTTRLPEPCR
jgi:hypothetical protein